MRRAVNTNVMRLGALAANSMLVAQAGWRDLRLEEKGAFEPNSPVEYWMPMRVNE